MKTIALRFGENFAPVCGTIKAHKDLINKFGYVWYGKLGLPISEKVKCELLQQNNPKILLIQSGKQKRYWAYIQNIIRETPPLHEIPSYYRASADKFNCWFKVTKFEDAEKNVMNKCVVQSSNTPLSEVSKTSLSPYFIIEY